MTKKHDIIWLDMTDSTNMEASRRISELDNLSVLSASKQTSGRGQMGNSWESETGKNLTFSILLKSDNGSIFQVKACDQFIISEAAALSVTDLLAAHGIPAKIKWPNDIYVGNRKICGILIQNSLRTGYVSSSIIGIGLNVNQTVFDVSLPNPISMMMLKDDMAGYPLNLNSLLEEFMDIFKGYCNCYLWGKESRSDLRKQYLANMWRLDETARFKDLSYYPDQDTCTERSSSKEREFTGIIRGLSPIGHLIVEDIEKGALKEYAFREISYII